VRRLLFYLIGRETDLDAVSSGMSTGEVARRNPRLLRYSVIHRECGRDVPAYMSQLLVPRLRAASADLDRRRLESWAIRR
jgi:hypothetical protein